MVANNTTNYLPPCTWSGETTLWAWTMPMVAMNVWWLATVALCLVSLCFPNRCSWWPVFRQEGWVDEEDELGQSSSVWNDSILDEPRPSLVARFCACIKTGRANSPHRRHNEIPDCGGFATAPPILVPAADTRHLYNPEYANNDSNVVAQ